MDVYGRTNQGPTVLGLKYVITRPIPSITGAPIRGKDWGDRSTPRAFDDQWGLLVPPLPTFYTIFATERFGPLVASDELPLPRTHGRWGLFDTNRHFWVVLRKVGFCPQHTPTRYTIV